MPGILYLVATPIGNLEDITLRALRVLREVQLIAAEDTRRTAKLLQHYSIATPATSFHDHNEAVRTPALLDRLRRGDSVAVVSDAGTPLISDPGLRLVRAAREAGIAVVPVPGASAILTALAASGLEANEFTFIGFPPRKAKALHEWAEKVARAERTVIFFESPHRITSTLLALQRYLADRPILVARELTKIHEELVVRPISDHLTRLEEPRGEFTIIVPAGDASAESPGTPLSEEELVAEVGLLTKDSFISPRQAAREVARKHGLSANVVYGAVKRMRG